MAHYRSRPQPLRVSRRLAALVPTLGLALLVGAPAPAVWGQAAPPASRAEAGAGAASRALSQAQATSSGATDAARAALAGMPTAAPPALGASAASATRRAEAIAAGAAGRAADLGALDALTRSSTGIDPDKVLDGKDLAAAIEEGDRGLNVMIFASLGMPEASLRRLATDAARAGIPVYLRGLKYGVGSGNFQRGVDALAVFKQTRVQFQIHPEMFERYDIQTVPAVVVSPTARVGCDQGQCVPPAARVFGDVSLDYALEKLSTRKDDVGALARATLKKFE